MLSEHNELRIYIRSLQERVNLLEANQSIVFEKLKTLDKLDKYSKSHELAVRTLEKIMVAQHYHVSVDAIVDLTRRTVTKIREIESEGMDDEPTQE